MGTTEKIREKDEEKRQASRGGERDVFDFIWNNNRHAHKIHEFSSRGHHLSLRA